LKENLGRVRELMGEEAEEEEDTPSGINMTRRRATKEVHGTCGGGGGQAENANQIKCFQGRPGRKNGLSIHLLNGKFCINKKSIKCISLPPNHEVLIQNHAPELYHKRHACYAMLFSPIACL
jgi:hypothetical protein